jgi:DNA-binding transcriptional MerR regulator
MAELSASSGVPVATIKYYLRERLMPSGESAGINQAHYDESHRARLRLIRALIDVGGLSVASARAVIDAIDSDATLPEAFAVAQHSVSAAIEANELEEDSLTRIDAVMSGWRVSPHNPGRLAAARALEAFHRVGQTDERGWFARYADAALILANADLDEIEARPSRESKVETVVVGTALGDVLISGLRRAAQEHVTAERY